MSDAVKDLLAEIRRIDGQHAGLDRRTRGVAWMTWGLVLAGIFVSYTSVGYRYAADMESMALWVPFLWIPWVVVGGLLSYALWRSVGLGIQRPRLGIQGLWSFGVFVAFTAALFVLFHYGHQLFDVHPVGSVTALGLTGVALIAMAATGIPSSEPHERRLRVVGGAGLLALTLLAAWLVRGDEGATLDLFAWLAPLAVGLVAFGGGLYLTLRG